MTSPADGFTAQSIPARAGIGLRSEHYQDVLATHPAVGFFEVHSENFFGLGGAPHRILETIRADYPLSFHGVGMSLGSVDPLNKEHSQRLKQLVDYYQPGLVSEHLSWSSVDGQYFNDLLPLPYTPEALHHIVDRVRQIQDTLQRQILVENVSSYLQYTHSTIPEWEFVAQVAEQSGCGILLDVNNIYVNAVNHNFDARIFLGGIPAQLVKEIHLAGHTVNEFEDGTILIDTHDQLVCDEVWSLYRDAVRRFGPKPTLIEWDTSLPELSVLLDEASTAQTILDELHARVA
jgi:uncharacterized protein (UPF0276 family)